MDDPGSLRVEELASPFDGGRSLRAGALGVAFSVPELFLVNLRKGTFEYGPAEVQSVPTILAPSTGS